jgi:hypothetical protein
VKKFLQAITRFNPKIIESIVQGVPVFITRKMVVEMLHLPKLGITKLLTKSTKEKDKERENEKEVAIYQKIFHRKHLSTRKDGRFSFSKEGVQPYYRH